MAANQHATMLNESSSSSPSSSSPHVPTNTTVTDDAAAYIAQLQAQLDVANTRIARMNKDGNLLIEQLNAEQAKNKQIEVTKQLNNSRIAGVKIPIAPQFKGEVGFTVDTWIRRMSKQFDFYGEGVFPDDTSRIKFAVMYLEGGAMDWWDRISESDKSKIVTWTQFIEALHSRFRPMQAAMIARQRLASLKQTGAVAAYVNLFLREITPITDMSNADQIFNFRAGLKQHIAQRVLEKLPKTLHEAMDIAILADAHTNKMSGGVPQYNYTHRVGNGSSVPRAASASSSTDMDISNVNHESDGHDDVKPPMFHEEDGSSSSSANGGIMREFNRMKAELKKYQTQAEISAISSSTSSTPSGRVQVSKEDFDYCFANRLCLKCKKPNHRAAECRGKYQPLK
jgi:hypothetical protein